MKKLLIVLALGVCFLGLAAGCTQGGQTPAQNTATVELAGNPTTGYTWVSEIVPDGVVREVSCEFLQDSAPQGTTGVGGTFVFTFEAVAAGEAEITFSYLREWEDVPAVNTAIYKATVDAGGNLKLEILQAAN